MSQQPKLFLILGLTTVCAGCVGTGPNTQQGAVAGGALGAVTGAIIGNASGHNGLAGAIIGGTVGAIAGGTIGNNIDHENGTVYGSEQAATTTVVVEAPPPMPPPPAAPVEMGQPPTPDAVFIAGYWAWDGRQYVWANPHWIIPPPGYHQYYAPHWRRRPDGTSVYVYGYWR